MEIRRVFVTGGTGYLGGALDADSFADQVTPAIRGRPLGSPVVS